MFLLNASARQDRNFNAEAKRTPPLGMRPTTGKCASVRNGQHVAKRQSVSREFWDFERIAASVLIPSRIERTRTVVRLERHRTKIKHQSGPRIKVQLPPAPCLLGATDTLFLSDLLRPQKIAIIQRSESPTAIRSPKSSDVNQKPAGWKTVDWKNCP